MDAPGQSWVGRTLKGRYRVEAALRAGGMGAVYRAVDLELGRVPVVVKHPLNPVGTHSDSQAKDLRKRFAAEVAKLIALRDLPGVVRITDQGVEDGIPFYVMDFMAGGSLQDRLSELRDSPADVLRWAKDVAATLDELHARGLVHRDVKPHNLLFQKEGGRALVADFGIVKELAAEWGTTGPANTQIGTPGFMAPEQFLSHMSVDGRCDQFALAASMYVALTGKPLTYETTGGSPARTPGRPTSRKSLRPLDAPDMAPHVPPAAAAAVSKGLEPDPDHRFDTCTALVEAYEAGLRASATGTRAVPTAEGATVEQTAGPAATGRRALVALLALAAVGVSAWFLLDRQPSLEGKEGAPVVVVAEGLNARARRVARELRSQDRLEEALSTLEGESDPSAGGYDGVREDLADLRRLLSERRLQTRALEAQEWFQRNVERLCATPLFRPKAVISEAEAALRLRQFLLDYGDTALATQVQAATTEPWLTYQRILREHPDASAEPAPTPSETTPREPEKPATPPPAPWEAPLAAAEAAMAKDDGEATKVALAKAVAADVPASRVAALQAYVADWDVEPVLTVSSPARGAEIEASADGKWRVEVKGSLATGRKGDRLLVGGVAVLIGPGEFARTTEVSRSGTLQIVLEVRSNELARKRLVLDVALKDRPGGATLVTQEMVDTAERSAKASIERTDAFTGGRMAPSWYALKHFWTQARTAQEAGDLPKALELWRLALEFHEWGGRQAQLKTRVDRALGPAPIRIQFRVGQELGQVGNNWEMDDWTVEHARGRFLSWEEAAAAWLDELKKYAR